MLLSNSRNMSELYEFVASMSAHMPDHDLVAPFVLAEWADDEETDPRDRCGKCT